MEESYLACTATGDDAVVFDRSLHDHDCIMQTSLDLGDELLRPSSKYERACFCCRASLKEVESLSSYLPLLKLSTCAKVLWLDVGAS